MSETCCWCAMGRWLYPGLAFVPSDPGPDKQETHTPGNCDDSKERPLWNFGDKEITHEMSAPWPCLTEAELGPWEKSLLCEGVLGVARFF